MPRMYISPQEFRDEGYLQEVNRRFLHPLGLAIEMVQNKPGEPEEPFFAIVTVYDLAFLTAFVPEQPEGAPETEQSKQTKEVLERVERAIENSNRAIFSGVWDDRDDPEGIRFALNPDHEKGGDPVEFYDKANHVQEIWRTRRRERASRLGYNVQPYGDHYTELGSDIVALYGQALGEVMSQIIPVKAASKDWQKAARTILDRICEIFAGEPYNPDGVTAEEVHVMDLVMGPQAVSGKHSRVEALNQIIDTGRFYKEFGDVAAKALSCIAQGDIPPGHTPQEAAGMALSDLASMMGG